MNTKTDGISSGLVAHIAAFKEALNGTKGDLDAWLECNDESEVRQAIFGIISEAEAKLSECVTSYEKEVAGLTAELDAKDVEIERLALYKNLADEYGLSVFADLKEQSAALKLAKSALENHQGNYVLSKKDCIPIEQALAAIDALKGE